MLKISFSSDEWQKKQPFFGVNSWLQKIPMAPVFQQIGDGFPMKSCDLCTLQRWNFPKHPHVKEIRLRNAVCLWWGSESCPWDSLHWLHVTPCFKISISPPKITPQQIRSFFRFPIICFPLLCCLFLSDAKRFKSESLNQNVGIYIIPTMPEKAPATKNAKNIST